MSPIAPAELSAPTSQADSTLATAATSRGGTPLHRPARSTSARNITGARDGVAMSTPIARSCPRHRGPALATATRRDTCAQVAQATEVQNSADVAPIL
ncbi:MAG: hypothetical protein U1E65_22125 [Myxococcota bacterium]